MEIHADRLIVDERAGRRVAEALGLRVAGVLGLLVLSKQRGHIPTVRPLLDSLLRTGFRADPDLVSRSSGGRARKPADEPTQPGTTARYARPMEHHHLLSRVSLTRAEIRRIRELTFEHQAMLWSGWNEMNTSVVSPSQARARRVEFVPDAFVVHLRDGRSLTVPIEWFPRLRDATPEQRSNWRLIGPGIGIHWPDLDEDLSVADFSACRTERQRAGSS